jgi:hypothetical protein
MELNIYIVIYFPGRGVVYDKNESIIPLYPISRERICKDRTARISFGKCIHRAHQVRRHRTTA